jgi:hypothetical protein
MTGSDHGQRHAALQFQTVPRKERFPLHNREDSAGERKQGMRVTVKVSAVILGVALVTVMATGQAGASTRTATVTAASASAATPDAVPGASLALTGAGTAGASTTHPSPVPGLTSAQTQILQAQVNYYLHELGGTQIAANEIRLQGGADLLLVLPGQKYAHYLTGTAGPVPDASVPCPNKYFCAYDGQDYEGSMLSGTYGTQQPLPFSGTGSYINDLGGGGAATFLGYYEEWVGSSCQGYCAASQYDWAPVYYFRPIK